MTPTAGRITVRPIADAERAGCAARTSQNSQKNYNNRGGLLFSAFFCVFSVFCVGCWTDKQSLAVANHAESVRGGDGRHHSGAAINAWSGARLSAPSGRLSVRHLRIRGKRTATPDLCRGDG